MTHIRRTAAATLFTALAAAALWLAARPDGHAADKGEPAKATSPLDYVPADATAVLSVRLADWWDDPASKPALEAYMKNLPGALENHRRYFGVEPADVDRQIFFSRINPDVLGPNGPSPLGPCVIVTTRKPYDRKAILDAVAPGAQEQKIKDHTYYTKDDRLWYAFLDDRTYICGQEPWMKQYLSLAAVPKDGPMAPVLKLAAEKHTFVAGVQTPPAVNFPGVAPGPEWVRPLLKSQLATLTVDLDGQVKAEARATFANEADAKAGAAAANDALDVLRGQFVQAVKELTKDGDAPKLAALLKDAQAALREAKAEQKGAAVEVAASLKLDPDATPGAVAEAVERIQKTAKRLEIVNDLKQLALATINFADTYQAMPPPAIYDKNGKALLSWRVAILPFIEQNDLYKQFKLDEPWDSDNNKKLLEKMPAIFAPPDSEAFKKHETYFQAFVGKGSVFEQGVPVRYPASITDGTSQTILFVEAAKSVPWTKPEDVPFDQGKLLPKVGGLSKDRFMAAFCDGSVRMLPLTIKEETLHALVTRAGGEVIPPDFDK